MTTGVKFPFTIQGGSVALTDNPLEVIGSRIVFCMGTMMGERVMNPLWGMDILSTVWSIGGDLDIAMQEAIENGFRVWFPKYEAREVTIYRNPDRPTYIEIEIRWGRFDSAADVVSRVGTQLPGGTETYMDEGF